MRERSACVSEKLFFSTLLGTPLENFGFLAFLRGRHYNPSAPAKKLGCKARRAARWRPKLCSGDARMALQRHPVVANERPAASARALRARPGLSASWGRVGQLEVGFGPSTFRGSQACDGGSRDRGGRRRRGHRMAMPEGPSGGAWRRRAPCASGVGSLAGASAGSRAGQRARGSSRHPFPGAHGLQGPHGPVGPQGSRPQAKGLGCRRPVGNGLVGHRSTPPMGLTGCPQGTMDQRTHSDLWAHRPMGPWAHNRRTHGPQAA